MASAGDQPARFRSDWRAGMAWLAKAAPGHRRRFHSGKLSPKLDFRPEAAAGLASRHLPAEFVEKANLLRAREARETGDVRSG